MTRRVLLPTGLLLSLALAPVAARTAQQTPPAKPAASAPASADAPTAARKACDDLKDEISKKLDAKGVKNYTLDAVVAGDVKPDDKVIGSCDGGTKKITYKRG